MIRKSRQKLSDIKKKIIKKSIGIKSDTLYKQYLDNRRFVKTKKSEYEKLLSNIFESCAEFKPDLKNPVTFTEKLNYMKLYDKNPLKTLCSDKLKASSWAKKMCPEINTIKIIACWKKASQIDFSKLPEKFVLKCNHGSGMNIIITDKKSINKEEIIEKLNFWMHMDFSHWNHCFEMQYKNIKRRIICEEYIETKDAHGLVDYKIYCFNGKAHCMQCVIDRNIEEHKYRYIYFDRNWNNLHISHDGNMCQDSDVLPTPPLEFNELLKTSEVLSKPFPFVRVDLYIINHKVYFGELTFTPATGIFKLSPTSVDKEWGDLLDISNIRK